MGKFNLDMMKKTDEKTEVSVGGGILNDVSLQYQNSNPRMDIIYVTEDRIAYNPLNKEMSKDKLEEMAQLIKMNNGLEQPLVVREYDPEKDGKGDYDYMLLTGERRLRGIRLNKQNGIMENYQIPCVVREIEDIPLPLDGQLKEEFAIAVSNKYRDKTDGDLYLESQRWQKIYSALKKSGAQYINYTNAEGDVVEQKEIKGKTVRELVANELGISTGRQSQIEDVQKHADEEVKQALLAGRTNIVTAKSISKLPTETQKEIVKASPDKITKKIVEKQMEVLEKEIPITKKEWEDAVRPLTDVLKTGDILLKESQKKKFDGAIAQLVQIVEGKR